MWAPSIQRYHHHFQLMTDPHWMSPRLESQCPPSSWVVIISKPQIYLSRKDQSCSDFTVKSCQLRSCLFHQWRVWQGSETLCSRQNGSPWHLQCLSECQAPRPSLSTSPSLLDVQTVRGKQVLPCWLLSARDWNICFRQVLQMLSYLWCYEQSLKRYFRAGLLCSFRLMLLFVAK